MKKILKILGGVLVLLLVLLMVAPMLFKDKIAEIIKVKVNESVNAQFNFTDLDLSFISSFPKAAISLEEVSLLNNAPFKGDTLFAAKEINLELPLGQLFKGENDPFVISSFSLDGGRIDIKVDKDENANYDIAIEEDPKKTTEVESDDSGFVLSLQSYAISDTKITYQDAILETQVTIADLMHSGSGDLSAETTKLDTETTAKVSFLMGDTKYLNKNDFKLEALLDLDLKEGKYSFLENKAWVNKLLLVFDGYVKLNDNNQEVDISFKTPSTDFSNFLALVPAKYTSDISDVETSGNFEVSGNVKGIVDDTHIPAFTIDLKSDNATLKYPDLPKAVKNIKIDTRIGNKTGIIEDTYVDVNNLSFGIDQDKFALNAQVSELMGNTKVKAKMNGHMDLSKIAQAYPIPEDLGLKGILDANLSAAFDMASLEKNQYQNTKAAGNFSLKDFVYNSTDMNYPLEINNTSLKFDSNRVVLEEFSGKTGSSDFNAKGTLTNFLGFLFNDENIKGNLSLASTNLNVTDFMSTAVVTEEETPESTSNENKTDAELESGPMKIPAFLDCTIQANAKTVHYDNLELKDVSANLVIKDQKAILSNVTSSLLGGSLSFGGVVSTQNDVPTFDMALKMNGFNLADTFESLELFKAVAPIAKILEGSLNSNIKINGLLKEDFTPNLAAISGDVLAEILGADINPEKSKLASSLDSKLGFLDLKALNLKDLKTAFSFKDGKVALKPMKFNYKDIPIVLSGAHSIGSDIDYKMTMEVPAKYLGKEVSGLLAQLGDEDLENVTVPVSALIVGNATSPSIKTDLSSVSKDLTSKLVEVQKQKLLNKGGEELSNLLGGLGKKDGDSTKTSTEDAIGGLLSGIGKKNTDTTNAKKENDVTKAANVLGGLFGKKKKKDTIK